MRWYIVLSIIIEVIYLDNTQTCISSIHFMIRKTRIACIILT